MVFRCAISLTSWLGEPPEASKANGALTPGLHKRPPTPGEISAVDDLIADFVAECREMLEALGGEIVAWEAQPDDRARLDSIFRFVHTVKGNCGFFDFPRLEALSHAAEDALADVRANRRHADGALVSAVLAVIDRIGEMVSAIEAGEETPGGDDSALIHALE